MKVKIQRERGWFEHTILLKRRRDNVYYGILGLTFMALSRAVDVFWFLLKMPSDSLMKALAGNSESQIQLLRAGEAMIYVGVSAVCAVWAYRVRTRLPVLIGLALIAVDWIEWAFGIWGVPPFRMNRLGAMAFLTLTLLIGLWAAHRYQTLKAEAFAVGYPL
jgi:hypothetical protein